MPETVGFRPETDFSGRQIVGGRKEQQDVYAFSVIAGEADGAESLLLVLADGMGGHEGGRQAACAAVTGFVDAFFDALDAPQPSGEVPEEGDGEDASKAVPPAFFRELGDALSGANAEVDRLIVETGGKYDDAGTTLLALAVTADCLRWISVGDSPLFLWRGGEIKRLNADHSMRFVLAEKVAAGQMLPRDLLTHPERNMLLSALRGVALEDVDHPIDPLPLLEEDIIIAASDGVLTLSMETIGKILNEVGKRSAVEIVKALLEAVEQAKAPKQDNTTVAVICRRKHEELDLLQSDQGIESPDEGGAKDEVPCSHGSVG
jgi:serine/threonine protein phosphatase PrpC